MKHITAYKLFRVRKDGSIGSLFINKSKKIEKGEWIKYEEHPTNGFKYRPGWHACSKPVAPHLSIKNRQWYIVHIKNVKTLKKPESQGGKWFLAEEMKVIRRYNGESINYAS